MILFSCVLIIPLFIAIVTFFFTEKIDWRELIVIVALQILVAGISSAICYNANTSDTEIWNGIIVNKKKVWTSCSHSYSCHCHQVCSGFGKSRSCHQHCDTCYEHINDWDWNVYTSNQETIQINRIDRRGSIEPPRWTMVKNGEPTSTAHDYTNYIKAAPDSLFRYAGEAQKYNEIIPAYPDKIYDYYKLNRLVLVNGVQVIDRELWDADIRRLNADLGMQSQVNVIVVLVQNFSEDFFYALSQEWLGGKKNDVILVVNLEQNKPVWANVMAWSKDSTIKIKLRDSIMQHETLQRWDVMNDTKLNVAKYYVRKPMHDFEYLKSSITPSLTMWIITMLIGLIVAAGSTWYMHENDVFD